MSQEGCGGWCNVGRGAGDVECFDSFVDARWWCSTGWWVADAGCVVVVTLVVLLFEGGP